MADFTLNGPGADVPWVPGKVVTVEKSSDVADFRTVAWFPLKSSPYPGCPGATGYGFVDERPIFHAAHEPEKPCIWHVAPDSLFINRKAGDVWRIELSGGLVKWYVNDVGIKPDQPT